MIHTGEGLGQERDMSGLIVRHLLEVLVQSLAEASLLEVLNGEFGETLAVELVLCER